MDKILNDSALRAASPLARSGFTLLLTILVSLASPQGTQAGINEWTTSGPEGGWIRALAIDTRTPGVVYAGTDGGGVFKSSTGGNFWTRTNAGLANEFVLALAIDPQTPTRLYAGTDGGGVFKSTNGGASWSPSNAGLGSQFILALAIDPQTPTTLYAGTDVGVFKSTGGGAAWSPSNAGLANRFVFALAIPTGRCLHAGTRAGTFSFATQLDAVCPAPPSLAASLSTTIQSVPVGATASTIATVTNTSAAAGASGRAPGDVNVSGFKCGITQLTGALTSFSFQAVDATNQPIAPVNTPVDIAAGSSQKLSIKLTPSADLCARVIQFGFNCTNTGLAPILTGVNTLNLTAGTTAGCGLIVSASASKPTFVPGDTLIAGGSVANFGLAGTAADFYVGVLRPDNSIQFVTSTGIVVGNAGNFGSFRPLAVNVPLTTAFADSQARILTHQWTTGDLRGGYVFFVAAVKTGALAGGYHRKRPDPRVGDGPLFVPVRIEASP